MNFNVRKLLSRYRKKENLIQLLYKIFITCIYILIFIVLMYIGLNKTDSIKTSRYEAFIIVSDSMKPEIKTGDIIIIKKIDENEIKTNDIITFEKNGEYITHRVKEIKVEAEKKIFTTKGDNNLIKDTEQVNYEEIKGIKFAKIPYIGLLILQLAEKKNLIIILVIFILLYKRARGLDTKRKERVKKKRIEDERFFKNRKIH